MDTANNDLSGRERPACFEEWRESIREICGSFHPEQEDPAQFGGWAKLQKCCGFDALDVACNVDRIEREMADVRRDQVEHFFLIFQLGGRSSMIQNDRVADLSVGDGVIIDSVRPSSFRYASAASRQISLHLPRKQLIAYLGFEPQGGHKVDGTHPIARMLFEYVASPPEQSTCTARAAFQDLLVYDLLGSIVAPMESAAMHGSIHVEKLFRRVCEQIEQRHRDPTLKISDIAELTGISVRYIQKLFTQHNDSFCQYLERLRLERAAMMLRRRAMLPGKISISEVAASCGFGSLSQFSRSFSESFKVPPSLFMARAEDRSSQPRFASRQSHVRA